MTRLKQTNITKKMLDIKILDILLQIQQMKVIDMAMLIKKEKKLNRKKEA